jgi:hypothetical protein
MGKIGILREFWIFFKIKATVLKSEMQKNMRVIPAKQQDLQWKTGLLFVYAENVLKTNAECETKLLETFKVCIGIDEAHTLFGTLEVAKLEDIAN